MIFIANGADFSANNLGQIPLYSIEDVSQSTLAFLSHYTKSFSDEQKIAVHQMLTFLGYGTSEGIFSKLKTIIFPFLSKSVEEAMKNAVDWSDITTRNAAAAKDYFSLEGGVLKTLDDTQNHNNINLLGNSVPNLSFGLFNTNGFQTIGNASSLNISFNTILVFTQVVGGIPSYRMFDFEDNSFCASINDSNIILSSNLTSTNLYEDESYEGLLVSAIQGKSLQYIRYNKNKGFSCIFVGDSLSKEEIDILYKAIKTCMSTFL